MSNKKKSFLLHIDSLDILDDLTIKQSGLLFKAIKAYQNDEDIELDDIVKLVFSPFKNQFIRDDEKYTKTCERRAIAGSKGGKQKVANASKCKQTLANVADSVSKNKNDSKSDNDSDSKKEITNDRFNEFWNLYAKKTGKPKCERLWKKLSQDNIDLIFQTLPAYIFAKPDKQFRKDPERWLKHECWNDEVINNEVNTNNLKKESSHERIKRENDIKYRNKQPDQCGLVVGENDGYLGRTVDEGERESAITRLDIEPFIDYDQSS